MTDINIGKISEALNNKVDLNFNNMNPTDVAKESIVNWGVPDYNSGVDITPPTSDAPYTCEYDCEYVFSFVPNASLTESKLVVDGVTTAYLMSSSNNYKKNRGTASIRLKKGSVIYFTLEAESGAIYSSTIYPITY